MTQRAQQIALWLFIPVFGPARLEIALIPCSGTQFQMMLVLLGLDVDDLFG